MTQIIRNNNASAAAVFDTASVAYTPQTAAAVSDTAGVATQTIRRPLHPASQGPLAPTAAVFDTAAVASRRVAVSDTVTAVVVPLSRPCLKKTLKYTARRPSKAQVQSTLRAIAKEDDWNALQQNVASATALMEQQDKELFDKVTRVYKFSNKRGPLEKALEHYAAGKKQEWKAQWQVVWADYKDESTYLEQRREQVKAHYEDLETVLAEADNSTPKVAFDHFSKKEYVLTEWERVHVKLGEARRKHQLLYELPWVPHTKYPKLAPVPSQAIKRGGTSAYAKDHMDLDDYSKRQLLLATRDWIRHGNIEALALHQQPLTEAVVDTSAVRRQSTVVSDTTAAAVQSTPASVVDTSAVRRQSTVVSDTTAATVQSRVVSDTTATVQSTPANVVDTSARSARVQSTVVSDTTAAVQPLRRSARIAARNQNRDASAPVRRTSRKGAAKPKGFYKV